jgi:hypothetical protein
MSEYTNNSSTKEKSSEKILSPEYYVEDLDSRGALINPATIISRQIKELKRAVVIKIFGREEK